MTIAVNKQLTGKITNCLVSTNGIASILGQLQQQQQQQQHSLFSQASWGRLEMKPERNKFKVQAH